MADIISASRASLFRGTRGWAVAARSSYRALVPHRALQPALGKTLWGQQLRRKVDGAGSDGDSNPAAMMEAARREPLVVDNSRIIETELRSEAEKSYLAYAMSVIVGRALPDVRDGLKPVHRRILFAMHELGLAHNKPFKKCARVVGEVLGKFHPHGDTAVYDALVRMAQDFSMRAPLVDGHGNFGSLDDDPPAAMRYTECRLQPLAAAMLLQDLEADTVDYVPNFDASQEEPSVLPARLPNLLINGSSGIAVGIATKIPPHNMGEVVEGLKALIRNPDITVEQLMRHIPAPDFPTGGEIIMSEGVREAFRTGRGGIVVRAKMHIEDPNNPAALAAGNGNGASGKKRAKRSGGSSKPAVVVTELPYQTNKASLVEQIAKLVDDGTITMVSDVRDESDRDGMRVVVEVKRGSSPDLVLNQLLKHTSVQTRFSCNMVALVGATPKTLNLKEFLSHFLDFRCKVVERRTQHELDKARRRLHLVDGFLMAMRDLDAVVAAIRQAADGPEASRHLQAQFGLSQEQAEGVLGMTLRRLTSLETSKLQDEQAQLQARIEDLSDLLQRHDRVLGVVQAEAEELAAKHGTPRRTAIVADGVKELTPEDVTPNAPSLVVYSRKGYIKRMSADTFTVQGRAGRGKAGARLKAEDSLEDVVFVNDHDQLLFLTGEGQAYSLKAYEVPEGGRTAIGTAMAQLLPIDRSTPIAAMVPVSQFKGQQYLVMLTEGGQIKRTALVNFSKITSRGLAAMKLKEGDRLKFVGLCSSSDSILVAASDGQALHIAAENLKPQSRTSSGLRCMTLKEGSQLVAMGVLPSGLAPDEEPEAEEEGGQVEEGEEEEGAVAAVGAVDAAAPAAADGAAGGSSGEGSRPPWLMLVSTKGKGKRIPLHYLPVRKGRMGKGLRVMGLSKDDRLAAAVVVGGPPSIAHAASATAAGALAATVSSSDGASASVDATAGEDEQRDVVVSTAQGLLVRLSMGDFSVQRRTAKGVRVIKLQEGDEVSAVTLVRKAVS